MVLGFPWSAKRALRMGSAHVRTVRSAKSTASARDLARGATGGFRGAEEGSPHAVKNSHPPRSIQRPPPADWDPGRQGSEVPILLRKNARSDS
jgi:hypothetical protein